MKVASIHYNEKFALQFKSLPKIIQKKAVKAERLLRQNPFHPSLRLHKLQGKLKGLWSISLDRKHRIVFKIMEDGAMLFISIGVHAIYDDL